MFLIIFFFFYLDSLEIETNIDAVLEPDQHDLAKSIIGKWRKDFLLV